MPLDPLVPGRSSVILPAVPVARSWSLAAGEDNLTPPRLRWPPVACCRGDEEVRDAAWPFLVVVDLDEVTVRCRACRWVSPTLSTVAAARLAYLGHHCPSLPVGSPFLGWCAICGRVRLGGLRPVGPPRPRAWVHTWVCAGGCRRGPENSPKVISRLLSLVVAAAAAVMSQPAPSSPEDRLYVVGDQAGAWDVRPCPQAPAGHPEQPGGPA
jgi:hypothetical protein